ncbi:hypothetical protein GQ457_14G020420 [Hibiscus cannabinus]
MLKVSYEFSVPDLKYKVQCIKWQPLPSTRQISSGLHHRWRWWKSRRSSRKVSLKAYITITAMTIHYSFTVKSVRNKTHAFYHWNRNDDGKKVPTDSFVLHNQYW